MSKTTAYYDQQAQRYDNLHAGEQNPEHVRALERSWPLVRTLAITSIVDVGCGTGRSLEWFARRLPSASLIGIDPSDRMLEIARKKVPDAKFLKGSGEKLPLADESADVVVASGIMHHVDHPQVVIGELFRVAKLAVLISDHNNFAFGGTKSRQVRRWLAATGLLGIATFVKQGFRKQGYSEGDGWWYPYSLLQDFGVIARASEVQYIIPTSSALPPPLNDLHLTQTHLSILALKHADTHAFELPDENNLKQ
jgi:ubiquinone/menaquinone biosynthesis C-methylase UbiE